MAKKDPSKPGRIAQIRQSYRMTKKSDRWIGLILLGTFVLVGLAGFALTLMLLGNPIVFPIIFGVLVGSLGALIVFGQRAQRAAFAQMDGKPGAAAAAMGMLRRGWKVEPAVGVTKQQDVVTRVVGPPGIVLIGEGNPHRLKPLMTSEHRKHARVAADVPVHEVLVGNGEGQIPLKSLAKRVRKLDKGMKPGQMTDVLQRLKALDAARPMLPMPKGPMPTSMRGARQNMRGR